MIVIKPKLRLIFNIVIGVFVLAYIGLAIFSGITNNIWFFGFLFIVIVLHNLKAIFAPKQKRNDDYSNN